MALLFKKHRSKAAKIVGGVAFILLMFFNLNISTSPNKQGDIDLFGLKVSLVAPTYAIEGEGTCCIDCGWAQLCCYSPCSSYGSYLVCSDGQYYSC
jgi:hypothetical protein